MPHVCLFQLILPPSSYLKPRDRSGGSADLEEEMSTKGPGPWGGRWGWVHVAAPPQGQGVGRAVWEAAESGGKPFPLCTQDTCRQGRRKLMLQNYPKGETWRKSAANESCGASTGHVGGSTEGSPARPAPLVCHGASGSAWPSCQPGRMCFLRGRVCWNVAVILSALQFLLHSA